MFAVFPRQMSHTKPYIRKKAVLIMYKVFLKYPESLRPAFPRLKEKLEDPDPGIKTFLWSPKAYVTKFSEDNVSLWVFFCGF